jgi:hypothetical protein
MAWGGVLRRISADKFYDLESNVITFEGSKGVMRARLDIQGETYFSGARIEEIHLTQTTLADYEGRFRSEELDATYRLSIMQGTLTLSSHENRAEKLTPIIQDEFDAGSIGTVLFHREKDGKFLA